MSLDHSCLAFPYSDNDDASGLCIQIARSLMYIGSLYVPLLACLSVFVVQRCCLLCLQFRDPVYRYLDADTTTQWEIVAMNDWWVDICDVVSSKSHKYSTSVPYKILWNADRLFLLFLPVFLFNGFTFLYLVSWVNYNEITSISIIQCSYRSEFWTDT